MTHAAIETVKGTPAYRVDVGGIWKHFRTAVCSDHGGNVYQSRTAPTSTLGLAAAGPRGVPCRVSYRDEIEAELAEAVVGQTPATSTSWLRAFGGAYSAPLPDGPVYFARAARKDGDELVTKADRMTLAGATTYCQDLLRRGFAVAAVFADFDDELWQDRCRMVAGPFKA